MRNVKKIIYGKDSRPKSIEIIDSNGYGIKQIKSGILTAYNQGDIVEVSKFGKVLGRFTSRECKQSLKRLMTIKFIEV